MTARATSSVAGRVIDELIRIPPHRVAALRLLEVTDDPESGSRDVADILATDPAMTARVLQLANAVSFGSESVSTATDAVTRLGFSVVRALSVGWATGAFSGGAVPEWLWPHSMVVAGVAAELARDADIPVGLAYSAGLLHDLGQMLLLRTDPVRYRRLVGRVGVDTIDLRAAERRLYGADHGGLLATGLRGWGLEPALIDAIATHHDPPDRHGEPLETVLRVAELTGGVILTGGEAERLDQLDAGVARSGIRRSPESLVELGREVQALSERLLGAFRAGG